MDGTPLPTTGDKRPGKDEYEVRKDDAGNYQYTKHGRTYDEYFDPEHPRERSKSSDARNSQNSQEIGERRQYSQRDDGRKDGPHYRLVRSNSLKSSKSKMTLEEHMRTKPNQPMPPSRPPPDPPLNTNPSIPRGFMNGVYNHNANEETKSVTSVSTNADSNSGSVSSGKRTRPPIHHTTTAQMRPFMQQNASNLSNMNHGDAMNNQRIQRTRSDDRSHRMTQRETSKLGKMMSLRSV